jgi:lysine 2,3-aminomutase
MIQQTTKSAARSIEHRQFRDDEFWREIPAWRDVSRDEFASHVWQSKNSVKKLAEVKEVLRLRIEDRLMEDIAAGLKIAPMNIRITPYVFALIDWNNPVDDPLRKQFLPIASQMLPDHPYYLADSLYEDVDSPVPMLTHRYPDKVLFLPLTTCPVYCSYCTRSRIIGGSTESMEKHTYGANLERAEAAFKYIEQTVQIEDVVISGGDAFNLTPKQVLEIGNRLLSIDHVRRMRYATKGIAILPQRITSDDRWMDAFLDVHRRGRDMDKAVVIHTHFSSPNEITEWSRKAMNRLFAEGVIVRNQAVMQEGVNSDADVMILMNRKLSFINIQPYYVYIHDMVPGCEHLRTTVAEAVELEKQLRGCSAGFNTPTFVCDAPGGGGKRHVASYEYYDKENGISVWRAPNVKPNELFLYFDPLHKLHLDAQLRWSDKVQRENMINHAIHSVDIKLTAGELRKVAKRLESAYHQTK